MKKSDQTGGRELYLFDTSAVIEFLKGQNKFHFLNDDDKIAISVLTIVELVPFARKRSKRTFGKVLEFIENCTVLPVDIETVNIGSEITYELILKGNQKPLVDILITSTASASNLSLITADTDFIDINQVADITIKLLELNN